mgnify:FL=1
MEKELRKIKVYSEELKQLALSEVKAGASVISVSEKYGISGHMTIYRWCKKYGVEISKKEMVGVPLDFSLTKDKEGIMSKKKEVKSSSKSEKGLEDKEKLMEYELALYKKLVEIAKRDYDLDLLKKLDTKQSKK